MMDSTDNRALPTDRATTPDGAEPVVSGKAGIPSAGAIGLSDTSIFRDSFAVCRVVKAGELGKMWTLEAWRRGVNSPGRWGEPNRRKVSIWMPLGDCDPDHAFHLFANLRDRFWEEQKSLAREYNGDVRALAQAIEAGTAETGTGSVHESAVHAPISPSEDQTNEPG